MTSPALAAPLRALLPVAPPALVVPPRAPSDPLAARLTVADLFPEGIVDADAARGCLAGILLLRDAFDRAHAECQDLDTADGAYWHGIAHRREPDPANAKYWMRRVGRHPIHDALARDVLAAGSGPGTLAPADAALATATGRWDAGRFIDACCAPRIEPALRVALEAWQYHEALSLLAHGAARAAGREG